MEIKTLAELEEPDKCSLMSRVWTADRPGPLSWPSTPSARSACPRTCPRPTRRSFERLCALFAVERGVLTAPAQVWDLAVRRAEVIRGPRRGTRVPVVAREILVGYP